MSTLGEALTNATERLSAHAESARLDAELLLAHALGVQRSYLFAWPERPLEPQHFSRFEGLLERRVAGQPIAYLLGHQEFWSLEFQVGEGVLIPRPDTETLVEAALEIAPAGEVALLDLGTGSGAIACALAHERPEWNVCAVDFSEPALSYARRNVAELELSNVHCLVSNWFDALLAMSFDVIVSNPPYIAAEDVHLRQGDLRFEPATALVSGEDGLEAIHTISSQAQGYLNDGGWLVLEHGYQQAQAVAQFLHQAGFCKVGHRRDLAGHDRVTLGQKSE